jgi:hypothetical protein
VAAVVGMVVDWCLFSLELACCCRPVYLFGVYTACLCLEIKMKKKYQVINAKIEKLKTQYNPPKTKEHHNNTQEKHTFFKRIENLTNITFTEDEMQLLNKGLKYNLHYKPKNWLQTLGLEAEIGIKQLPLN